MSNSNDMKQAQVFKISIDQLKILKYFKTPQYKLLDYLFNKNITAAHQPFDKNLILQSRLLPRSKN